MAVSVMQMTTTRPTGTFSTHFAQRLLSTSVSLYLCPSHLAALRLPPRSYLARAARALDVVRARTGFEPARVRRGYATLRAAAPSLRTLNLEYPE